MEERDRPQGAFTTVMFKNPAGNYGDFASNNSESSRYHRVNSRYLPNDSLYLVQTD